MKSTCAPNGTVSEFALCSVLKVPLVELDVIVRAVSANAGAIVAAAEPTWEAEVDDAAGRSDAFNFCVNRRGATRPEP